MNKCLQLAALCRELVEILETVEESDNGREFHPTTISSCRCLTTEKLAYMLPEMKSLSNSIIEETNE